MRFIIDAQLPLALSKYLENKGFDVIHTVDLPNSTHLLKFNTHLRPEHPLLFLKIKCVPTCVDQI